MDKKSTRIDYEDELKLTPPNLVSVDWSIFYALGFIDSL